MPDSHELMWLRELEGNWYRSKSGRSRRFWIAEATIQGRESGLVAHHAVRMCGRPKVPGKGNTRGILSNSHRRLRPSQMTGAARLGLIANGAR